MLLLPVRSRRPCSGYAAIGRFEPTQQIFLGPGAERTCLQRRRFCFRDVAVEGPAGTAVADTAGHGMGRLSAVLRRHSFAVLWSGASAAPGIRAGSSAAKTHARVDSRANFLELFCWRGSDCRRRLLARE